MNDMYLTHGDGPRHNMNQCHFLQRIREIRAKAQCRPRPFVGQNERFTFGIRGTKPRAHVVLRLLHPVVIYTVKHFRSDLPV